METDKEKDAEGKKGADLKPQHRRKSDKPTEAFHDLKRRSTMPTTTRQWIIKTVRTLPEKDLERLKDYLEYLTWKSKQQESEPKQTGKNPIARRVIEAIEKSHDVTTEDADALLQSIKEGEILMQKALFDASEKES